MAEVALHAAFPRATHSNSAEWPGSCIPSRVAHLSRWWPVEKPSRVSCNVTFGKWLSEENCRKSSKKKDENMLWTIAVILLVLWALGLVSSYTMGGFIHVLLVIAVIVVLIRLIRGEKIID